MRNFEILGDFRLHLKLMGDGPFLETFEGVKYQDTELVSPGVLNAHRLASIWCRGKGIDVGSSYFHTRNSHNGFPGAAPVDLKIPGSGDAENLIQSDQSQDYVFMSHILEHLTDPEKAISEALRVLRPRGFLFTYSPFPGNPDWDPLINNDPSLHRDHKWQPQPHMVCRLMLLAGFRLEYVEWEKDHLWSFVVVGQKP